MGKDQDKKQADAQRKTLAKVIRDRKQDNDPDDDRD